MKRYPKKVSYFLPILFLVACGQEQTGDLDKLLEKKSALKAELASIQDQIQAQQKEGKTGLAPLVVLDKLAQRNYEHKIIVQGNVETDQDVLINAEMGGLINQVHVHEGQRVSVGQVLVTLDASILSSNMKELETQLAYAEYMLEKQEELKRRGVGSEFEYKTALNQVNSLKSKMKSLSTQRGKSAIKAPFSGMIDKVFAKNGQLAGPQSPLLRLVNNQSVKITADISEKHLENVQVGTNMKVRFPNFKDTTLKLQVSHVGNYIDPTNRTFRVMSQLNNNKVLLPNMLAELEITDIRVPDAMVVPSKSILKSQQNEDYIFIAEPEKDGKYKARRIQITLHSRYDGWAHIDLLDHNVQPGAYVIVEGARGIADGDIVRTK